MWTIGVDEAGRGALLGPLVVTAYAHHTNSPPTAAADSKTLTAPRRRTLHDHLTSLPHSHHTTITYTVADLDNLGIDICNQAGIAHTIQLLTSQLTDPIDTIIVDGNRAPTIPDHPIRCEPKADRNHPAVSAASIIAKHTRDTAVEQLAARVDPDGRYAIDAHGGYPTPLHLQLLHRHGPADGLHRARVAPVRTPRLFI